MVFLFLMSITHFPSLELTKLRLGVENQAAKKTEPFWYMRILRSFPYPRFLSKIIPINHHIWSGIQISHQEYLALWWLVFVLSTTFSGGMILNDLGNRLFYLVVVLLIIAIVGPYLIVKWQIRKRKRDLERSLPDYLDMLSLTMEAGFGLVPALQRINKGFSGALGEIMRGAIFQINLGYSKAETLKAIVSQTPSADLSQFIDAILLSEQLGTSLARTIRIQAGLSRARWRQRAEVKARMTPIRIIPALVFFFLPGLLLIYLAPPIINFLSLS